MKKLLFLVFFLLFMLIQTTVTRVFPNVESYFLLPNLPLILLAYIALYAGPEKGIIVGFMTGFFEDSLSVGLMGINAMVKTVLGCILGLSAHKFFIANRLLQFISIVVLTIANDAGRELMIVLLDPESTWGLMAVLLFLLMKTIPSALLNGVVGIVLIIVFEKLDLVHRESSDE